MAVSCMSLVAAQSAPRSPRARRCVSVDRVSAAALTICLALCTAACSSARALPPLHPSETSQALPTAQSSQPPQSTTPGLSFNRAGKSAKDGLLVTGLFDCAHNLVLASDQLSYTDADIQGMLTYLSTFTTSGPPSGSTPSFLTWEPGALVDAAHTSGAFLETVGPCQAQLNVTNTSDHDISITGGGVENIQAATVNTTRYATVDVCDLQENGQVSSNANLTWCYEGASQNCPYDLAIPLSGGDVGTAYTNTFSAEDGCTTISLSAHQSVDITMHFASQQALVYDVVPELTVTDGSGSHAVVFSDWSNMLVFATPDQMPCYQLQQDTFSLKSGAEACS